MFLRERHTSKIVSIRQDEDQTLHDQANLHTMSRQPGVAMRCSQRYRVQIYLVADLGRVAKVVEAIEADGMIATFSMSA
jgi:hypothetical protein